MRLPYRPRWPLLVALIAGIALLTALTYLETDTPDETTASRGGAYVEGIAGEPSRINPLFASLNQVDGDLASLVFAGLVRLGPKGEVQPDLAEEPSVSPDGLTYSFHLRSNIFWHDGVPLTADDVAFTVEAIQSPDFAGDPTLADVFEDVEVDAPNENTVVMTLPRPFAPFLAHATVGILPEHLLRGQDAAALFASPFNQGPIGSGPFRLVELTDDAAVFEPFDAYHMERPFLDRLTMRFYRDDATLLTGLLNDEVDGALFHASLDPDDLALIDGDSGWVRQALHPTTYSLVYLNPSVAALDDTRVRQALQRGLDRETLVQQALAGQALPIDSPIAMGLWAYEGSPDDYAYDPDLAAELLDEAGWRTGDNGREKDGDPLAFTLATSDDSAQARVAEEIARQWRELGLQVAVQQSGASQFVEGVLISREFEAALVSIDPGLDPDPYPFWHSTQALGEGRNLTGFANAFADIWLENGRQEASVDARAEDYRNFQEVFALEQPAVLLTTPLYHYVVNEDVRQLTPELLIGLSSRFYNVQRWYVAGETSSAESDE
ncbi:MAG: peptide ABC transporter substrate-binding protein [Dehalococcoidia bacterium]